MTNVEGRVIRRRRALAAAGGSHRSRGARRLAGRLGSGRHFGADPRTVFASCGGPRPGGRRLRRDHLGTDRRRAMASSGRARPDRPGTPGSSPTTFPTADGRARFLRVEHRPPAELPVADSPTAHHRPRHAAVPVRDPDPPGAVAARSRRPEPRVEVHPDLAGRQGIADGDLVGCAAAGAGPVPARLSAASGRTPSSHRSTGPAPTRSPTPPSTRFRGCPSSRCARWRSHPLPNRRDPLSETAPGGHRQRDGRRPGGRGDPRPRRRRQFAITMFGDEPYGNYNRIMLSHVLSGDENEADIFLNSLPWYIENDITLHAGVRVDPDRPVRQASSSPTTAGHAVRQADHRHRQPVVHAADRGPAPSPDGGSAGRVRVPDDRRHPRRWSTTPARPRSAPS